jgi:hypothetical protein
MSEWAKNEEFDRLWDKHVPPSGNAETEFGEAIRALGRLEYDYYNNGYMNAKPPNAKNVFDIFYRSLWESLLTFLLNNAAPPNIKDACLQLNLSAAWESTSSDQFHTAVSLLKQWLVEFDHKNNCV